MKGRKRFLFLPRCVARSQISEKSLSPAGCLEDIGPRFLKTPILQTPSGLAGVTGLFQEAAGGKPRCIVAFSDPWVQRSVDTALQQTSVLTTNLFKEYEEYFGPVGLSTATAEIQNAMCKAWSWGELIQLGPQIDNVSAFQFLLRRFRDSLSQTEWPDPQQFPYAQRVWNLPEGILELQSVLLIHNDRDLSHVPFYRKSWFDVTAYHDSLVVKLPGFLSDLDCFSFFCKSCLSDCQSKCKQCKSKLNLRIA